MQTWYASKSLAAPSSQGVALISTTALSSAVVIYSSNFPLDTQRRLTAWSTLGDISAVNFTITGLNESRGVVSEVLAGSTTAASSLTRTVYDYISVTSITVSSVVEGQVNVGTNTWGSTPWKVVDTTRTPISISAGLTITASSGLVATGGVNWDYSFDDPFGTYPNPNLTAPTVWVSSYLSAATSSPQQGLLSIPVAAWRMTFVSSVAASSATLSVIQSG